MWLLTSHQVDILHWPAGIARQDGRPDKARCSITKQIDGRYRVDIINRWKLRERLRSAKTVAGLVEMESGLVATEVNYIGRP
jgi:hypothetical protein